MALLRSLTLIAQDIRGELKKKKINAQKIFTMFK